MRLVSQFDVSGCVGRAGMGNQRGANHGRGRRICTNNKMERRTEHGKQQDGQEECVESGDYRSADNLGIGR